MTQYQLMKDTEKNPQHFEVIMAFGQFASSKISNRESNIALPVFFFFFCYLKPDWGTEMLKPNTCNTFYCY